LKITANNITLSRILLLPIPCYLVYGDLTSKMIGLCLFVLLGLTDFVDGILARRNGATVLGSLMDPTADKIFLVAIFIPLGDMGIIPLWTVFVLIAREFGITTLRGIFLEHKLNFKTTEFAKYKTNVQWGGAGFIFLTFIFKDSPVGLAIIVAISIVGSILVLIYHVISGPAGPRALFAAFMFTLVFLVRTVLPSSAAIMVFIAIVLFFTLLSGFQYAVNGWHELSRKSLKLKPRHWYLLLFYSVILPAIFVGTLYYTRLMTWAVIVIFAFEFAGRGLDNHITYCGKELHPPTEYAKSAAQMLGGTAALFAGYLQFVGYQPTSALALIGAVIITCIYNCLIFYRNHALLL